MVTHSARGIPRSVLNAGNAGTGSVFSYAGNVLSVVLDDSLQYPGDATVSYTYDDLHRLTRETCVPSQGSYRTGYDYRYSYDALGNRTGKTVGSGIGRLEITYWYSARNELMGETTYVVIWNEEEQQEEWVYLSGWYYGYDLRGNLTYKQDVFGLELWCYTWSADDKLIKAEYSTEQSGLQKTIEYKYDLLGRRVARRLNGGAWRWYFYDGLQVTAEGTATNDKMYYTHSPSAIGGIICRDKNGTKYWYHYDRLGNVMAMTNANGNPYAVYTMEAFGNLLEKGTSTGYYSEHATDPQPYHLTTKEYDPDVQLYYFNARWYEPATGRFVSRAEEQLEAEHPYALCENNPISAADPTGEISQRGAEKDIAFCYWKVKNRWHPPRDPSGSGACTTFASDFCRKVVDCLKEYRNWCFDEENVDSYGNPYATNGNCRIHIVYYHFVPLVPLFVQACCVADCRFGPKAKRYSLNYSDFWPCPGKTLLTYW
jgi:RHS repeat-associated protein